MSKRILNLILAAALFVLGSGLLALSGCGEDEPRNTRVDGMDARTIKDDVPLNRAGDRREERDLSPMELDTLRAMKTRLKVTRDEYWDNKGGVLANDFMEVWYPAGKLTVTHGMYAFDHIDKARKVFRGIFGTVPENKLKVVCPANLQDYDDKVGREWWSYSRIKGDEITYQPIVILHQRGLIDMVLPREYFEWGIRKISDNKAPRWLQEGFASILADEAKVLENQLTEFPGENYKMDMTAIESTLKEEKIRKDSRLAYYNCYRMVDKMIAGHGRDKIIQAVLLMGKGDSVDKAFEKAYQKPYKEVVAEAIDFTVER